MSPRLVIVHERFTEMGGSEQVVRELASMTPNSRVYAPVVDERLVADELAGVDVSAGGLQRLYRTPGRYAHLLPLLPMAMATADVSDADVVVTSHHAFANRVRVPDGVPVISYTHSPARWMWDPAMLQGEAGGSLGTAALRSFAAMARGGDRAAAGRVDYLVANSQTVAERIRTWWGRHAVVINPPVDVDYFHPAPVDREDFLLVAGRLVPYKKAAVAVAAATKLGRRLLVVGQGRARPSLERLAGPTVEFAGAVSNRELRDLFRRCAALLFPGEEDFGIIPVEAQACGAPVIAARAGGATETVIDRRTGVLVDVRTDDPVSAFTRAIYNFDPSAYDHRAIRTNAERFSRHRFRRSFERLLEEKVDGWRAPGPLLQDQRT
ncbi:MAG: glycosyltransferase [Acidimicrobiales bacterium]